MFRRLASSTVALSLALSGCELFTAPAGGYGAVFSVRGAIASNSCGAGAPSSNTTVAYNVEIRVDSSRLRWSIPSAGVSAQATIDATSQRFTLVDDKVVSVRAANPRVGLGPCALRRFDVLEGRVDGVFPSLARSDAGDASDPLDAAMFDASDAFAADGSYLVADADAARTGPPALHNLRETVGWAVVSGADCRDMIGVGPGQFVTLPCEQSWLLDARYEPTLALSR
jgi:hypothetical protein